MHKVISAALVAILASGAAFAQSPNGQGAGSATAKTVAHPSHSASGPVDHGPFTPQANQAYQGGGMVLEGAPGAPPPQPEATPPGQTPRNMVVQ